MGGAADRVIQDTSGEDAILLREFCHRAGNDCAVALAAIRMLGGEGSDDAARRSLVERASARIEASARLNRILAQPVPPRVEVGDWLAATCGTLSVAGPADGPVPVEPDIPETWLDGATARRLVLVAAELVANALKYGGAAGRPRVSLRQVGGRVALRVRDRGPGFSPGARPMGGGLGAGIVADLVAIGGGRIAVDSGPRGTTVRVEMPAAVPCGAGLAPLPGG